MVDSEHRWLYWFPRDCPRATWCAGAQTSDEDGERWVDGDAAGGTQLRTADSLYPPWDEVAATTLHFSGIRRRNALS